MQLCTVGAYNDIYRVLVTPVVGHLYVRACKAFAVQLDYLQLMLFFKTVRQKAANLSEVP